VLALRACPHPDPAFRPVTATPRCKAAGIGLLAQPAPRKEKQKHERSRNLLPRRGKLRNAAFAPLPPGLLSPEELSRGRCPQTPMENRKR
jgi:hypothetical protein